MTGLARSPAAHFVVLGAALFGLRALVAPPDPAAAPMPSDEEILYREALAHGLDAQDAVRERLARLARFVGADPVEDEAVLAREARALGLDREDLVVRRQLVRTMRLTLGALDRRDLPDDAALARHLAAHADAYRMPDRVRLTQVFLSAARRGAALERDAAVLLAQLRAGVPPDAAPRLGDPAIAGASIGPASRAEVTQALGPDAAAAVASAPAATWLGPLRSPWGLHLVWVHERTPGRVPPLAAVRARVLHAVLAERRAARVDAAMGALRARWGVERLARSD
jgi:hypothetical protein